ncbi:MAG: 3-methyl-2-oxobutanoate hydroxymethyltransferase [Candidatus Margulisiibacteriota bacterium]
MEKIRKITVKDIIKFKSEGKMISALTAYDHVFARILDEAGIDIILVGDSLGNVMLGYKNTLPVTMQEMIIHTQAVARGVKKGLIVADMPFGSYQNGDAIAVKNAIDLAKAGAEAVKVEGIGYLSAISKIIKTGIPVMGHLGFTPQSVNELGYRIQGKDRISALKLFADAKKIEKAGCFALVLEMVPEELAKKISKALKIPVIGIGAGNAVDGQVLVTYDLLGLYDDAPGFVKQTANLKPEIIKAIKKFIVRPYLTCPAYRQAGGRQGSNVERP